MHSKSNLAEACGRERQTSSGPAFIDDETVARVLRPADVLAVIARAFVDPPIAPPRGVVEDPGRRTILTMPALSPGGISTVKIVTALAGGGLSSHLLAFDIRGALLAVVEAHRLTALRTAAASVLAARAVGAGGARHLAVLGAGRQAHAHIEAFAAAFPLASVRIWARRHAAGRALADDLTGNVNSVRAAASIEEAVAGADIVACATPSLSPLLTSDMIGDGSHVDLVGGFRPDMREADDALMARAAIVADTPAALLEAGDLVGPMASGAVRRGDILLLADILTGSASVRQRGVTVFKSVGHAAEDLVVAEVLLARLCLLPDSAQAGGAVDDQGS